jgi:Ras-related protein Rab-8A
MLIGDTGVGKTCFLLRFIEDKFAQSHITTIGNIKNLHSSIEIYLIPIGIDFKCKTLNIDGKNVKIKVWDTAGQERFRTITQSYYKNAMGIVLLYDCTSEESFSNVRNWVRQIEIHANSKVKRLLVANKSDMPHKVITSDQGFQLA